jgi:hypothetical protein
LRVEAHNEAGLRDGLRVAPNFEAVEGVVGAVEGELRDSTLEHLDGPGHEAAWEDGTGLTIGNKAGEQGVGVNKHSATTGEAPDGWYANASSRCRVKEVVHAVGTPKHCRCRGSRALVQQQVGAARCTEERLLQLQLSHNGALPLP